MPKLKSSHKRLRSNLRARLRNKSVRSAMRTHIKRVRQAEDAQSAQQMLPQAMSAIDKAVKKGAVPRNTGSRYKSRLSRFAAKAA